MPSTKAVVKTMTATAQARGQKQKDQNHQPTFKVDHTTGAQM